MEEDDNDKINQQVVQDVMKAYQNTIAGQLSVGNTGQITASDPRTIYGNFGSITAGSSLSNANKITFVTKKGEVSLDIETGDVVIPVGIGRDTVIRDFWLAFQEHFVAPKLKEKENRIQFLQDELTKLKSETLILRTKAEDNAAETLAKKVAKRYEGQKFIMETPNRLVQILIEEGAK